MSKTDKTRPLWVQNAEHGHIDHDHADGVCVVSHDQRDRWPHNRRNHYRRCAKRVEVEYYCTKDEPYRGRGGHYWRRGWDLQTCWTLVRNCECPIPEDWKREDHGCTSRWIRVKCTGPHTRIETDNSIPCVCDDWDEIPTCFPSWEIGRHYTWGGVPSEFVRRYYHKPERARERELRDLAREYNAYGDLEDGDFVNRQGRNSCRWLYW
jgi:hypothetical protein